MLSSAPDLVAIYTDLHAHPELGFGEVRTAGIAADLLRSWGYAVTTGIGGTGVAAVLDRGAGPTVLLRADMDGLPVREDTGLPYASTAAVDRDGVTVPTMHACGHDVHVTCLLGAAHALADDTAWSGRLVLVLQPAEELGVGARAMVDDGLYDVTGKPDVVLGQHVTPLPAGVLGVHPGPAFATSDTLSITLHGRGGHGSRPEATVDPVVMAAALVLRLQTIVSREVGGLETAVVTVGTLHAGTAPNVIPDTATLQVNVRTYDEHVRSRVLAAIERVAQAESAASGAPQPPTIAHPDTFPALVNDLEGSSRTAAAFRAALPEAVVIDPGPVAGSEDVGDLATAVGAPCVYWLLGGADPARFASATGVDEIQRLMADLPANHSPRYAPVPVPTLAVGTRAMVTAAREWLA